MYWPYVSRIGKNRELNNVDGDAEDDALYNCCNCPLLFFQKKSRYVFGYLKWYQIGRNYKDTGGFFQIFNEEYIAKFCLEIPSDVLLGEH